MRVEPVNHPYMTGRTALDAQGLSGAKRFFQNNFSIQISQEQESELFKMDQYLFPQFMAELLTIKYLGLRPELILKTLSMMLAPPRIPQQWSLIRNSVQSLVKSGVVESALFDILSVTERRNFGHEEFALYYCAKLYSHSADDRRLLSLQRILLKNLRKILFAGPLITNLEKSSLPNQALDAIISSAVKSRIPNQCLAEELPSLSKSMVKVLEILWAEGYSIREFKRLSAEVFSGGSGLTQVGVEVFLRQTQQQDSEYSRRLKSTVSPEFLRDGGLGQLYHAGLSKEEIVLCTQEIVDYQQDCHRDPAVNPLAVVISLHQTSLLANYFTQIQDDSALGQGSLSESWLPWNRKKIRRCYFSFMHADPSGELFRRYQGLEIIRRSLHGHFIAKKIVQVDQAGIELDWLEPDLAKVNSSNIQEFLDYWQNQVSLVAYGLRGEYLQRYSHQDPEVSFAVAPLFSSGLCGESLEEVLLLVEHKRNPHLAEGIATLAKAVLPMQDYHKALGLLINCPDQRGLGGYAKIIVALYRGGLGMEDLSDLISHLAFLGASQSVFVSAILECADIAAPLIVGMSHAGVPHCLIPSKVYDYIAQKNVNSERYFRDFDYCIPNYYFKENCAHVPEMVRLLKGLKIDDGTIQDYLDQTFFSETAQIKSLLPLLRELNKWPDLSHEELIWPVIRCHDYLGIEHGISTFCESLIDFEDIGLPEKNLALATIVKADKYAVSIAFIFTAMAEAECLCAHTIRALERFIPETRFYSDPIIGARYDQPLTESDRRGEVVLRHTDCSGLNDSEKILQNSVAQFQSLGEHSSRELRQSLCLETIQAVGDKLQTSLEQRPLLFSSVRRNTESAVRRADCCLIS